MSAPFVRLGRVVKAHGREGEVSVALSDDLPLACLEGIHVWVVHPLPAGAIAYRVASVRPGPKGALVKLEDVDSPEDSRAIAGRWLLVRAGDVPETSADATDVDGYTVSDAERGVLGLVTDTIVTGANDVWVVEGRHFGQVLVPVIDDVVMSIDHASRTIAIRLLPGLIDEDDS